MPALKKDAPGASMLWWELSAVWMSALLAAGGWAFVLGLPLAWWSLVAVLQTVVVVLIAWFWPAHLRGLGPANRVTLLRSVPVVWVTALGAAPTVLDSHAGFFVGVALLALALDGVDGWVARRWRVSSAFGARFDMELDAFFILALCLVLILAGKAGAWVVAIGAMRYAFVAAMWRWPWLDAALPDSRRRKLVCVWQVATLLVCLFPQVGQLVASLLLASALGLLSWSFAVDIRWLHHHRKPSPDHGGGPALSNDKEKHA